MGAVPGRRWIWPVERMLPCVRLSRHGRQPAAREGENTTFGSGNSAGTAAGSGTSLERSPSTEMTRPSEALKVSRMLAKSKSS